MSVSRRAGWFIWLIASTFYAYQYILRIMPSVMLTDISKQFNIDSALFGQFSGIYYIGYALMHLPIGIMLDKYGPRRVISLCILLTTMGTLPIIFSTHSIYLILGRGLIGVGSSAAILGTFKIIRMAFREKLFPRMLSISVTIGLLGAIYGGGPVSYLCSIWPYKTVVGFFALVGLVLSALTYCIVPEIEATKSGRILHNVKIVLTHPKVLLLCCFAGLMVGPLEGFSDIWGPQFLMVVYGFSKTTASYLPSMIFLGMCFGAPILSLIAEKTGYYYGVIIGSGLFMFLTFTALITLSLSETTIIGCFILVGVCCAYQILAIYKASTYVDEHLVGLTTAIANMIIMSFGYFFHSVIGLVIHASETLAPTEAFKHGISVIPITLALGSLGFLYLALRGKDAKHKGTVLV